MSYSIIAAILLATIALSSAGSYLPIEQNALARFYSDFAQMYRPALVKSFVDPAETMVIYNFRFTEKEYLQIAEESLTMLNTNVLERTIVHHPTPNFEKNGTRYFYRRSPKLDAVEIELVDPLTRLFRDVQYPNRYFHLTTIDNIEFTMENPLLPYYEVSFICNATYSGNKDSQVPVLTYLDKNLQYTPRYLLDLPIFGSNQQTHMTAFADIRNIGDLEIVLKGAELVAGDISLTPKSEVSRTAYYSAAPMVMSIESLQSEPIQARPLGEQASGSYVYQLLLPSSVVLPPRSTKSVNFLPLNVTIKSFAYYSSVFSPVNSRGKLLDAYNLTSLNNFLPNGRLILREQGRYVGQVNLPNLSYKETHTMTFGVDADMSYRRKVQLLAGNETSEMVEYNVEYVFESAKPARDILVYFTESFGSYKYFEITNLTKINDNLNYPQINLYGTDLRGSIYLTPQNNIKFFRFNLILFKSKPFNFYQH